MRWILASCLALMPISVSAAPTALMCFFKPLKARFNLITKDNQDMIQWESSNFQAIVTTNEDKFLVVRQYGATATFKAAIDVSSGVGYGIVSPFTGKPVEGDIICAAD